MINQISSQAKSRKLPEDAIQNWKKLPQDSVDAISSYIPYKEGTFKTKETGENMSTGLVALRLTSKGMNQLVENSPAGQLARKANNLEPDPKISTAIHYASEGHFPVQFMSLVGGAAGGVVAGSKGGFEAGYAILKLASCSGHTWLVYLSTFLGLGIGCASGLAVATGASLLCGFGIFECQQIEIINRNEIHTIRNELTKSQGLMQNL